MIKSAFLLELEEPAKPINLSYRWPKSDILEGQLVVTILLDLKTNGEVKL